MKKLISVKNMFLFFLLLIIGGLVASTVYFYTEYQKVKKNPDLVAQQETKTVTDSIKKFMELPADEEPTLATITDQEKLKDQEFFKNAQNGDKVLIYATAKKAILYRPSTNKVIEFAPLVLDATEAEGVEQSGQAQEQPTSVAIYNGTQTVGLSAEYEKKVTKIAGLAVTSKTNATKNDYTKTLVIDLSGKHSDLAKQIAQTLGGELASSLPEGETKPETDILVIAGE